MQENLKQRGGDASIRQEGQIPKVLSSQWRLLRKRSLSIEQKGRVSILLKEELQERAPIKVSVLGPADLAAEAVRQQRKRTG